MLILTMVTNAAIVNLAMTFMALVEGTQTAIHYEYVVLTYDKTNTTVVCTSLECYQCGDEGTGVSVNCSNFSKGTASDFAVNCGKGYQSCISAKANFGDTEGKAFDEIVPLDDSLRAVISRECGQGTAQNGCAEMRLGSAAATVCSCSGDRCNAAEKATSAKPWLSAFLVIQHSLLRT